MVVVNSGVVTARQTASAAQTGAAHRRRNHQVEPASATPNRAAGKADDGVVHLSERDVHGRVHVGHEQRIEEVRARVPREGQVVLLEGEVGLETPGLHEVDRIDAAQPKRQEHSVGQHGDGDRDRHDRRAQRAGDQTGRATRRRPAAERPPHGERPGERQGERRTVEREPGEDDEQHRQRHERAAREPAQRQLAHRRWPDAGEIRHPRPSGGGRRRTHGGGDRPVAHQASSRSWPVGVVTRMRYQLPCRERKALGRPRSSTMTYRTRARARRSWTAAGDPRSPTPATGR